MYLKALELENFKSFGRHVEIPLERGYTGVTGPNGSGKSNISDAILFVLGPKSGRVIRAGRLTDLIFNGGRDGKPASHCSASLVFDNANRALPIDADEVKLTRVIRLSTGEAGYNSYFYINDRRASLGEFDALLLHSNISADGYNIVQQGDVARMVSMTPLERRRVLEQVAGIGRYDEDIQRAQGERTRVEENLQRLAIILGEIKNHLNALERERTVAMKYQGLKGQVEKAKGQLAYKHRESIAHQVESTRAQMAKYETEGAKLEAEKARLREGLAAAQARLQDLERKMAEAGGPEARQIKERLDHLRIERARATDGLQAARDGARAQRVEVTQLAKELASIAKEIRAIEGQAADLQAQLRQGEGELTEATEAVTKVEAEAGHSDARVEALQTQIAKATEELEGARRAHHTRAVEESKAREVAEVVGGEVARLEEVRKELLFELQDAEWHLKEMQGTAKASSGSLVKLQGEFHALRKEASDLEATAATLEGEVKRLTREYERLRAEVEATVARGPHRAIAALLDARDRGQLKGIHGTVEDLATIEEQFRVALEVAAGPRLQALVVDDDGVAEDAIDLLKRGKVGRATLLPMNKMLPGHPRGKALMVVKEALGFAIDLVRFDERYRGAFWYVFGDTVVVKDLSEARRLMGGVRLVTLDGQLVEASGAIVGGSLEPAEAKTKSGGRGELERLGKGLRAATEEGEAVGLRRNEVATRLAQLEAALRDLSGASEVGKSKVELLEARAQETRTKLVRLEEDLGTCSRRWQEATTTLPRFQGERERLEERMVTLAQRLEDLRGDLGRATPREFAKALKEAQGKRARALERVGGLKEALGKARAQLELLRGREGDATERQKSLAERGAQHATRATELEEYLTRVEEEIQTLAKVEESLGAQHQKLRAARDEAVKTEAQAGANLDRLQNRTETRLDFLAGLRTELKVQEAALTASEEEFSHYTVDASEAMPSLETMRSTIAKVQGEMEALGAVNLRALDEFEVQAKRHGELRAEVERLQGERTGLLRLVEELNGRKHQGLLTVFKAIDENFRSTYADLSEGGEGSLELERPDDPFQGGLTLRVRPPNKRSLRLEALSGGEKGLVSMAFIFALQRYDPSPFYMLDEVDQNLDAINAERVARMVRRNSTRAQFIQVSLRKVSLKEADHLLGVTMGPRGQSEVILKLDLGKVQEEAAPAEEAEA